MRDISVPGWIPRILIAAGIYNVLWGLWVVLFPNSLWSTLQVPTPNYLELWQCIGMIVGVYGVGYAIAAYDPVRHWPIVLVGFLGKIFGPIGMIEAVYSGRLPVRFGAVCLTNDLIWWLPFALILRFVWKTGRWR